MKSEDKIIEIAGMKIKELDSFPPEINPFNYDGVDIGQELGTNVTVMYANFPSKKMKYMTVINTKTGKRIRIYFPDEKES